MNGGRSTSSAGYTIIETIIFLAVSGAMFVSAMAIIGGRQAKAEFTQAVRGFESSLQDIANDVSTGYYADATKTGGSIQCQVNGANNLRLTTALGNAVEQGAKKDCIFVGKAIQFAPQGSNGEKYSVLTLVGQRLTNGSTGDDVQDYSEANITAVAPDGITPGIPDATSGTTFLGGAQVKCVFYANSEVTLASDKPCNTTGVTNVDMIAFITTFHGVSSTTGQLQSGSSQVDLVVSKSATNLDRSQTTAVVSLNNLSATNTVANPAGGIYVCLQSGGTEQYSLIAIGGKNSQFSADADISGGSCS